MLRHCFSVLLPALVLGAAIMAAPAPVAAHPHVWIYNSVTVVFEGGEIVAIRHRWEFDELFSSYMIQGYDTDGDGTFDAAETAVLKEGGFDNLREHDYFTHIRLDGVSQPVAEATGFQAAIEYHALVYEFTTPFAQPLAPGAATLQIGVYDATYYVDVTPAPEAAALAGDYPSICSLKRGEDAANPIYFGSVNPPVIWLTCAGF